MNRPNHEFMLKPEAESIEEDSPDPGELSLRTLFDREETNLLRYAYVLTGRRAVAEEIVQDAFLELHARWMDVQNPKAWLLRCVRNKAFQHIRKNQRELLCDQSDSAEPMEPNHDSPDAQMQRDEINLMLRGLLESLSEDDQQLVRWKYFEGLKYREISERSGLTVSNVGFRLHRILKQLAGELKPLGIEDAS